MFVLVYFAGIVCLPTTSFLSSSFPCLLEAAEILGTGDGFAGAPVPPTSFDNLEPEHGAATGVVFSFLFVLSACGLLWICLSISLRYLLPLVTLIVADSCTEALASLPSR